jgi:hypothetical protein
MAKLIKAALLEQTGLRLNKVKCRGDDGDDDDEDEGDGVPEFVPGVEIEDRDKRRADEGSDEPPKFVPGVEIKEPTPALAAAPQVWRDTRQALQASLDQVKSVVQAQVADENPDFVDDINEHLQKLDRIMSRLDKRLMNSLTNAVDASDATTRSDELKKSKAILAEYIRYVGAEPLIDHLDKNPFGVKTNLKATLVKSLTQVAKAIG